jgi:isochorismate pyruvate lyase
MKRPEDCESLDDVRLAIDALDREIIAGLGQRARYVEAAARFKTGEPSIRAPERQRTMLEAHRRWAEEEGLRPRTGLQANASTTIASYRLDGNRSQ